MKRTAVAFSIALLAASAIAHPGSAGERELLSTIGHLALTALPVVVVVGLMGLAALAQRRRA